MGEAKFGQLRTIGTVAAENITRALQLGDDAPTLRTVERAVRDEINAMSSHFTLALADVQTQYEADVARIKSAFTYVNANIGRVIAFAAAVFAFGVVVGLVV